MVVRHTLFKCSQYSRVHIDTVKISVPHGEDKSAAADGGSDRGDYNEEHALLSQAYKESEDGYIWKLVVTGMEVKSAIDWLEKVAAKIYRDLHGTDPTLRSGVGNGSSICLVPCKSR